MVVQRMGGNRSIARATSPMRGGLRLRREQPLPAGVTVRQLQRSDTLALGHLMVVAYSGTFDDRGQTRSFHESEAARTIVGEYGAVQWDASLVAEAPEGEVIGATVVTHDRGHLLLAFALVAPAWRNQGLGTALIVRSGNRLVAAGLSEWTLAVTTGNPARQLYERLGFHVDQALASSRPDAP
jgi:GNAT superfamily N-acetyltransferase